MSDEQRRGRPERAEDRVERDRMQAEPGKSGWIEDQYPAATDSQTEEERQGMNILGRSSVRDDAIGGVASRDPQAGTGDVLDTSHPRENPPVVRRPGEVGEGGISMSGGQAGGARGNSGKSHGQSPSDESRGGPAEYRSTSRGDLDHGTAPEEK